MLKFELAQKRLKTCADSCADSLKKQAVFIGEMANQRKLRQLIDRQVIGARSLSL
jgi:hypothetical protein